VGNYAFFLVAGRTLGPRDYGQVAALLAATLVVAVPAQSLQFATARLVANPPQGDHELAEGIYRRSWRKCVLTTGFAVGLSSLTIVAIDAAHSIPVGPLLTTLAIMAPLGFFFLALGQLQGQQRFRAFSTCFALWGLPRPIVLVPLAALGLGVYAGLGATGAAVVIAAAAATWLTRHRPAARAPDRAEWRAFSRPLVPMVVGLSGLGLITNLDVIAAKLAFGAESAGQFAAAATLAKSVFLIPQAASFVLLPRVAARSAVAGDTGMLMAVGLTVTLVAGGIASLVVWSVAEPLLRLTYGAEFTGSSGLLGAYAAASTLIGALIVVINHHLGRGADEFVWAAGALAAVDTVLLFVFHDSQAWIVAIDAVVGVSGLLLHEWMFFGTRHAIIPAFSRALRQIRQG
jgi:O-antigen/teichoic acid export membrane protein